MRTAAIYARKSTEQNGVADEQKSVTRQIEHARAYAEAKGWTVDEDYVFVDDGISGAEFANRPGVRPADERAEAAAAVPGARHVGGIAARARSDRDRLRAEAARPAGVRVFFYLEDRERTLDSPDRQDSCSSLTAFADELEREKARQRTYDAHGCGRRAPATSPAAACSATTTSTSSDRDGAARSHVERRINESEAAVVRRIFELCASGSRARADCEALNDEHAPCAACRSRAGRRRGRRRRSARCCTGRSIAA